MPLDEAGAVLMDEGRHDRPNCMAFVVDGATETAIQEGLADVMPGGVESRRGGVRAAITALQKSATPRVLIIDLGGEKEPLSALEELSNVVEPNVCVLVTGDLAGLDFYREVTRSVGAMEYLVKPLTREVVARHFGPLAAGRAPKGEAALGGRLLTVTGARGGVGASTVAVNLAWYFGVTARRHTVLLDPDLHFGTASFLLNVPPGKGLSAALQTPERIDSLLAERAGAAGDRPPARPGRARRSLAEVPAVRGRRTAGAPDDGAAPPLQLRRGRRAVPHQPAEPGAAGRGRTAASWCWSRRWPGCGTRCG